MNILKFFGSLLGKKTKQNNTTGEESPKDDNDLIFHQEGFEEFEKKFYLELELRRKKSRAIIEANGDLSKVFCLYDLKESGFVNYGKDENIIGYYSSIRKLGLDNGFSLWSLYRHQKKEKESYYLARYIIKSLEDEVN